MRVLHVYRTYLPETQGGLEETIRQICRSTSSSEITNRILTLADVKEKEILERGEAEVVRYPCNLDIASCRMSFQALRNYRDQTEWADIIHYHFPWPFADVMHFVNRIGKPAVMTYHSDIIRQKLLYKLYQPLMRRFLDSMRSIVATSPNYLATSDVLMSYRDKVDVIPIGLDPDAYPAGDRDIQLRLEQRVGRDFFLFIGVLRYYKGLHVLLDAMQGIDLPVVIAGTGPLEQELKHQATRNQLENTRFLGRVTDAEKVALLSLARAVVFPSTIRSEAFGITLLEGAMFGKPLISTEIGTGTSYINKDAVTGIVVPPADPGKLRSAIQRLHEDAGLADSMGKAACKRFSELFTADMMGRKYIKMYQNIIERKLK